MNHHRYKNPKGSSHILIRMVFSKAQGSVYSIAFPINLKNVNPDYEFICPCNPWKKLSYENFVNHVVKRHERITPKFVMRGIIQ